MENEIYAGVPFAASGHTAGPIGNVGSVGTMGVSSTPMSATMASLVGEVNSRLTPVGQPRKSIRELRIEQLNNGYIVHVGCHSFAFHTKKKMLKYINSYVNDPNEAERKWVAGELF
jgi:hypothetical protein